MVNAIGYVWNFDWDVSTWIGSVKKFDYEYERSIFAMKLLLGN